MLSPAFAQEDKYPVVATDNDCYSNVSKYSCRPQEIRIIVLEDPNFISERNSAVTKYIYLNNSNGPRGFSLRFFGGGWSHDRAGRWQYSPPRQKTRW